MKAIVDGSLCAGHARCVFEAPEVYELDDLGYNSTTIDPVPPGLEDKARRVPTPALSARSRSRSDRRGPSTDLAPERSTEPCVRPPTQVRP